MSNHNVRIYKLTIGLLKVLPVLIALCCVLNTGLMIIGIDAPIFSFLGGTSVFVLVFLYLTSYAFKFCEYHRMFLHYITLNNTICILDLYNIIRVSDLAYITIHIVLLGIILFLILYFYLRLKRDDDKYNKRAIVEYCR